MHTIAYLYFFYLKKPNQCIVYICGNEKSNKSFSGRVISAFQFVYFYIKIWHEVALNMVKLFKTSVNVNYDNRN